MRNFLLGAVIGAASVFAMSSCRTHTETAISYGSSYDVQSVARMSRDTFTVYQVDSMVKADNLPAFSTWKSQTLTDPETNTAYTYSVLLKKSKKTSTSVRYTAKQLVALKKYDVVKTKIGSK